MKSDNLTASIPGMPARRESESSRVGQSGSGVPTQTRSEPYKGFEFGAMKCTTSAPQNERQNGA